MALSNAQRRQCCYQAFLFILLTGFIASNTDAQSLTSWWGVGLTGCGRTQPDPDDVCPTCAQFMADNVFSTSQADECSEEPAIVKGLAKGARAAIIDCQARFNETKWNCSTLYGDHLFGSFVANNHTRETGVLNAYFTAGGIWSIAEDCHNQRIPSCACVVAGLAQNPDEEGNTIFEVCSANYNFGRTLIETFVESQISTSTFGGTVDMHNIQVGKELVNAEVETCRCHGVSGTCTTQTCYLRTPTVAEVGETLYTRYQGAVEVDFEDGSLVNTNPIADLTDENLVYSDQSPNFCVRDAVKGTLGVGDRRCDPNPATPRANSCSSLCCGNGFYTVTKVVPVEDCKFVFCCRVECNIVRNETIVEHFCNTAS